MTHVKDALGLLLLNSIAVYFPQIVPMFYSEIHSNKARNLKVSIWYPQLRFSATWDNREEITEWVSVTLQ